MVSESRDEKQVSSPAAEDTMSSVGSLATPSPRSAPKRKWWQKKRAKEEPAKKADAELDYSGINEAHVEVLKAQTRLVPAKTTIFTLYRFATAFDVVILLLGVFFAIVHGVALPMFTLVVGGITNNFNGLVVGTQLNAGSFQHTVNHNALYFVYIGIATIGSAALETAILTNRGEVLASRYRKAYLRATLRQNIGYFDKLGSGEVTTRITNDATSIQEAISEKSGNVISGIATFVAAIVISFASQWKLSLILLSGVFYIAFSMIVCSHFMIKYLILGEKMYSQGSSVAEEGLSAIRNTIAFGAQQKLAEKFDVYLRKTQALNGKKNLALSVMLGLLWCGIFWIYALAFWEGSRLIAWGQINIGKVVTVLTAMMIGAFQIGMIAPHFQFIAKGIAAARTVNETINRVPTIDSMNSGGKVLPTVEGLIKFSHVDFRYPSRPDVLVLPDFSLTIEPGQTVALVGSSGSGKSTVVGLLERFYEPLSGSITLDGVEINDLNVKWLRQQIGLVSQEPVLFATSIYANISYGLIGTEYENDSEEEKRKLVIAACKLANAYDFIQQLTDGLNTNVGDRGFLMSGGQKQRIAIARAIVGNPKILLLDEATSALDTKSEGIVQEALDRAAKSRTTIVIAHRLSTIKDADKIVVMNKGVIVEQGTHSQLLSAKGKYYRLVDAQQVSQQLKQGNENDSTGNGLAIQEDEFTALDDGDPLNRVGSRGQNAEVKISGMGEVKVSLRKIIAMLWRINKKERPQILFGAVCAFFLGMGYPALAMIMGKTVSSIMVPPPMYHEMRKNVNLTTGMFFMVGWTQMFSGFLMILSLTWAGEHLLRGVRLAMFKQFMRMDIAYFDHEDNTSGALTSILAKDGKAIEGLGGATFGQIMQSCVTVVAGIITGIAFNWRLGLVGTACVPLLLGAGFFRLYILTKLNERGRKAFQESGSMAASYVNAARTVQTLTREDGVCETYNVAIDKAVRGSRIPQLQSSLIYGLSEGLTPLVLALIFWYGSTLLRENKIHIFGYFVVFIAIVFGAQAAGSIFSYTPDMGKARQSSANVLRVLDAKPEIDTWSTEGTPLDHSQVEGNIDFDSVYFRYPTRPQVPVLRGLNLKIRKGQYVALVGPSGCGKSTTIGLIERFYNPVKGAVLLDGHDIRSFNLNDYRAQISLVQQEPMLYSGSIRDNILIGCVGNEDDVTDQQIEEVCKKANIHDFIMSLPNGYDTVVGSRGGLLSGGQKQRIAIARALIRNPKILLLDEATSALDSESEKVVQAALDEAAKGRTTLAVAHRLSTIQNADIIYVFEGGKIVESGKHEELLNLNGRYAELVKLQSLEP